ncbi:MAG: hypothetical protein Q9204_001568 [Flavoplaca sp. TL-2023a]
MFYLKITTEVNHVVNLMVDADNGPSYKELVKQEGLGGSAYRDPPNGKKQLERDRKVMIPQITSAYPNHFDVVSHLGFRPKVISGVLTYTSNWASKDRVKPETPGPDDPNSHTVNISPRLHQHAFDDPLRDWFAQCSLIVLPPARLSPTIPALLFLMARTTAHISRGERLTPSHARFDKIWQPINKRFNLEAVGCGHQLAFRSVRSGTVCGIQDDLDLQDCIQSYANIGRSEISIEVLPLGGLAPPPPNLPTKRPAPSSDSDGSDLPLAPGHHRKKPYTKAATPPERTPTISSDEDELASSFVASDHSCLDPHADRTTSEVPLEKRRHAARPSSAPSKELQKVEQDTGMAVDTETEEVGNIITRDNWLLQDTLDDDDKGEEADRQEEDPEARIRRILDSKACEHVEGWEAGCAAVRNPQPGKSDRDSKRYLLFMKEWLRDW